MIITFLGTRGNIKIRSSLHKYHTATLISYRRTTIMIDCGLDWLGQAQKIKTEAIFITHVHEDHAAGLRNGAPCPVYATAKSWEHIKKYTIAERNIISYRKSVIIGSIAVHAYPVEHALNAPAVGYKITAGKRTLFYVPDVAKIVHQRQALRDVDLYIGDGALLRRTLLLRKKKGVLVGHAPIVKQLSWCTKEGVPRAIITHCGTEIVSQEWTAMQAQFKTLSKEFGIKVQCAYDGLRIKL